MVDDGVGDFGEAIDVGLTGAEVSAMDTPAFAAFISSENSKWGALVKELGLKDK